MYAYRQHVDESVLRWSQAGSATSQALDVFELGLNHEQQHQELILTDLKHLLSRNPLKPAYAAPARLRNADPGPLRWVSFPAGLREIGHGADGFCFDNESPRHRVYLESVPARDTARDQSRVSCLHRRRRL